MYFTKNFNFLFLAVFLRLRAEEQSNLWQTFDDSVPGAVTEEMKDELLLVYKYQKSSLNTRNWMPVGALPRNFIEHAISGYLECTKQVATEFRMPTDIHGAEWWIERRDQTGFRFDTNEFLSLGRHKVEHPLLSTTTHFTTGGAPTVIFNTVST